MKHTSVQKIKLIYQLGDTAKCPELGPVILSQDLLFLVLVSWAYVHFFTILQFKVFRTYQSFAHHPLSHYQGSQRRLRKCD